jgi:hypothetical protein
MKPEQLLKYIIQPALEGLDVRKYGGRKAEILLLATCAQETNCANTVHQIGGPALGIYQCEPYTHHLVLHWIERHAETAIVSLTSLDERLIYDLDYATKIARMLYYSIPEPLPAIGPDAMWLYYKAYYNRDGKATEREWAKNWTQYVQGELE